MIEHPEDDSSEEAVPEGTAAEGRPDEDDVQDPAPEQADPESGAATDEGSEPPSQPEG